MFYQMFTNFENHRLTIHSLLGARRVRAGGPRRGRRAAAALCVSETAREMLVCGAQLLVEREAHAPQLVVERRFHPLAQLARELWRRCVQRLDRRDLRQLGRRLPY